MKVDTSFLQVPLAAAPHRPEPRPTEQASARPVDRPHHDEPTNNQSPRHTDARLEKRDEALQPEPAGHVSSLKAVLGHEAKPDRTEGAERRHQAGRSSPPQLSGFDANPSRPAPVGELLDVIA